MQEPNHTSLYRVKKHTVYTNARFEYIIISSLIDVICEDMHVYVRNHK